MVQWKWLISASWPLPCNSPDIHCPICKWTAPLKDMKQYKVEDPIFPCAPCHWISLGFSNSAEPASVGWNDNAAEESAAHLHRQGFSEYLVSFEISYFTVHMMCTTQVNCTSSFSYKLQVSPRFLVLRLWGRIKCFKLAIYTILWLELKAHFEENTREIEWLFPLDTTVSTQRN